MGFVRRTGKYMPISSAKFTSRSLKKTCADDNDSPLQCTGLKEQILVHIPELEAYNMGREMLFLN